MGLRLAVGIEPAALAERLGVDRLVDDQAAERLARMGLMQWKGSRLSVTPQGRLLLDSILGEIAA